MRFQSLIIMFGTSGDFTPDVPNKIMLLHSNRPNRSDKSPIQILLFSVGYGSIFPVSLPKAEGSGNTFLSL